MGLTSMWMRFFTVLSSGTGTKTMFGCGTWTTSSAIGSAAEISTTESFSSLIR
jgi:hypothetical protein